MIVWLASYPRSGNTLTRILLNRVFGQPSYTVFGDGKVIAANTETARAAGHRAFSGPWDKAYRALTATHTASFVKTHQSPADDAKAIYIVRHPCAAVVSFVHYQRDVRGRDLTAAQVLLGLPHGTSWGSHLDDWDPLRRPGTLLLRYEELLATPQRQIERIADFTGLDPIGHWDNDFESLRAENPIFFRRGLSEPPWDELGEDGRRILERVHGDWLSRLGYAPDTGCADAPLLRRHLIASNRYLLDQQHRNRAVAAVAKSKEARTPLRRIGRLAGRALTALGAKHSSTDPNGRPARRIIAFSVYGDDPVYRDGAIHNALAASVVFPGWTLRYYIADDLPADLAETLRELGAQVELRTRQRANDGVGWRFLAAADHQADAIIVRDVDSLLDPRDKAAVDAWIASGHRFHIIRDHPDHATPILSGLWGVRGGVLPQMETLLTNWDGDEERAWDQRFLAEAVYPLVAGNLLVNSEFVEFDGERAQPLPGVRTGDLYLGYPAQRGAVSRRRLEQFRQRRHQGLKHLPLPPRVAARMGK